MPGKSILERTSEASESAPDEVSKATSHHHSHSHSSTPRTAPSLFSHSHTHGHGLKAANPIFEEQGGLKNPSIRITVAGLVINLGMVGAKGIGGLVFHSQALMADAVHALSDLLSDILTLLTVYFGSGKPQKRFPNGTGRLETVGSLAVSGVLVAAGLGIGWDSLMSIFGAIGLDWSTIFPNSGGHHHSHLHLPQSGGQTVDFNAAWFALASILVKEWIFRATLKVAHKTNSSVLVANAWHHRVDSLTSLVALATISGSALWNITWLDALGGLIVSFMVVRIGAGTSRAAFYELIDSTDSAKGYVEPLTLKAQELLTNTDFSVESVTCLPSGPNYTAEIQLKSNGNPSFDVFRQQVSRLKSQLHKQERRLTNIKVTASTRDIV